MEPEIVGKRVMKLMEKHNMKIEELANKMQLDIKKVNEKLNGKEEFYLDEMIKIKTIFELDTKSCDELFFHETTKEENKTIEN